MQLHVNSRLVRATHLAAAATLAITVGSGTASAATTVISSTLVEDSFTGIQADKGGLFIIQQVDDQSTGTGVIQPFLLVQANGPEPGSLSEAGYNTDGGSPYDSKQSPTFQNQLLLGSIPVISLSLNGGPVTEYREFLLDINQTSNNPLLSLNQLQIFTSTGDPGMTDTRTDTGVTQITALGTGGSTATEVFRMSSLLGTVANPTYDVQLDYRLNPGSGGGDYKFFIANSLFAGLAATTNITLY